MLSSSTPSAAVRPTPLDLFLLATVTAVGLWLRFNEIGGKSLWYDEAVIYHLVQHDWREILVLNSTENSAPPLYPLLLGLLTGPGASEAALRAFSAVAGTAAIPLAWILAREWLTPRLALFAPLFVAFSPSQVWFSQQVREYALGVCVAILLLVACSRFIRRPETRTATWFALAAALAVGTQYGLGLLLAALNLVCLVALLKSERPRDAYRLWFFAQWPAALVVAVLVRFVLPSQMAIVAMGEGGYLEDFYWNGTWPGLLELVAPENDIFGFAYPTIVMPVLTVAGALAFLFGTGTGLATAFFAVPLGLTIVMAMAGWYPFGAIRQDLFLMPMFHVCASIALAVLIGGLARRLPRPATGVLSAVVVAALVYIGGMVTMRNLHWEGREPMRPLVARLVERVQPGDEIYVYDRAVPAFRYYWRDRPEPWIRGSPHWSGLDERHAAIQLDQVHEELLGLIGRGRPFWMVITAIPQADADEMFRFLGRSARFEIEMGQPGTWLLRIVPRGSAGRSSQG